MKLISESQNSDWAGIISSVVCIVHCLALPVALSLTGVSLAGEESYHWLDYLFVFVAGVAMWYSLRRAHSRNIRFSFVLSWFFFAGSVLLKDAIPFATVLMYMGSLMLILTHTVNIRQGRQSKIHSSRTLAAGKTVAA